MEYIPGATITLEFVAYDGATGLYPQCVVRNLDTDATISTVNLDDAGGGRYRGTCQLPNNSNGGLGYYISETTKIYSDSGHTTPDSNYEITSNLRQVKDAPIPNVSIGGGGAARVDYPAIAAIVRDIIASTLKVSIEQLTKILADNKAQMDDIQSFNQNFMTLLEQQISASIAKLPIAMLEKSMKDGMASIQAENKSSMDAFTKSSTKLLSDLETAVKTSYSSCESMLELQGRGIASLLSSGKINTKQFDVILSDLNDTKNGVAKIYKEMMAKFNPFKN